jgi:hypothetical protein
MNTTIMARFRVAFTICGALAMAAGVSIAGCGGGSGQGDGADTAAHAHTHPEGEVHDDHHHDGDTAAGVQARTTRIEFVSQPAKIVAGAPATWTITVLNAASGSPVADFDVMHEKLMHLIVVSSDLTWFNHLHPRYEGNGRFTLTASLPREGHYKLYADYTPKGSGQEVAQYELATANAGPATASALTPDTAGVGGWMIRSVIAAPEGEPEAKGGAAYQVALMPMPSTIVAGKDVMLHFQVRDAAGKPLTDLQPYLGAMGHAVLLSGDTKIYLHTHPMDGGAHEGMDHGAMGHGSMAGGANAGSISSTAIGSGDEGDEGKKKETGPNVMFHTNFPKPGLYKVWGQFQHKGKIITAPFVLSVG